MTPKQLAERINRLIELYYNAGLELIEMLRTLEDGYGKRKVESLIKLIDARLNELTATASAQYAEILGNAYYIGAMEAISGIAKHIPETQIDKSIQSLIHHRAVQAIMDESFYSILEATDNMSQDIKDRIQQVVQHANQRSLLQGVSRRQATKDAIAELSQEQIRGIVTRSGAKVPIDKYMAGVVQYHQRKAHVTGAENMITQNGYDLVYVNRVGITCEFCAVYQGRVYSISGNDKRFPKLEIRPPYHSHCVHSFSAWIEDGVSAEEVERMIQESNRPFTDSRTQQNIKRYNELQREKSRKNETRKQWMRYKAVLPNDTPDLRTFASMKARNIQSYQELQGLYRDANKIIKLSENSEKYRVFPYNKEVIDSEKYKSKFSGIGSKDKVSSIIAKETRRAIRINDLSPNERGVFVHHKTGEIIERTRGYPFGVSFEESILDGLPNDTVILTHNHPLGTTFSSDDINTLMALPQIKSMVAGGHNGKVYILSVGKGRRIDGSISAEYNKLRNIFQDDLHKVLETLARENGWEYEVR